MKKYVPKGTYQKIIFYLALSGVIFGLLLFIFAWGMATFSNDSTYGLGAVLLALLGLIIVVGSGLVLVLCVMYANQYNPADMFKNKKDKI